MEASIRELKALDKMQRGWRQKQSPQFGDYPPELRLQFKPKRNFIKLLDSVTRGSVASR